MWPFSKQINLLGIKKDNQGNLMLELTEEEKQEEQRVFNMLENTGGNMCTNGLWSRLLLVVAQELNRHWIGIDKSGPTINVVQKRLNNLPDSLFSKVEYEFLKEV